MRGQPGILPSNIPFTIPIDEEKSFPRTGPKIPRWVDHRELQTLAIRVNEIPRRALGDCLGFDIRRQWRIDVRPILFGEWLLSLRMSVSNRCERRRHDHTLHPRVTTKAEHTKRPFLRRPNDFLCIFGLLARERRRNVQDVVAAVDSFAPPLIFLQIRCVEQQPACIRHTGCFHHVQNIPPPAEVANSCANAVALLQQLGYGVTAYKAGASSYKHCAHRIAPLLPRSLRVIQAGARGSGECFCCAQQTERSLYSMIHFD